MKNTFSKSYDVMVVGAGIAGISASLAAARRGYSVCLLEKQTLIGGLATSGLIFIYLPLCDGEGHQVTFGIAEELLRKGLNYGPYDLSGIWGGAGRGLDSETLSEGGQVALPNGCVDRFAAQFSPAGMTLVLDTLLREAGVDLWLDTRLCDVETSQDDVTAVIVENDSGCGHLAARRFIDASGDAHLVRLAGGNFVTGKNFNHIWLVAHDPLSQSSYSLGMPFIIQPIRGRTEAWQATLTGRETSEFIREGWEYTRQFYEKRWKDLQTDRFQVYPVCLPSMPQFRTIAHIEGLATIRTNDFNQRREDSIGMVGDWRFKGRVWETPYGALVPNCIGNTLAAGRCVASDGDSWEAYRVIPACAFTGEVSGTAAALSLQHGIQPRDLTLDCLHAELRKNRFRFHRDE